MKLKSIVSRHSTVIALVFLVIVVLASAVSVSFYLGKKIDAIASKNANTLSKSPGATVQKTQFKTATVAELESGAAVKGDSNASVLLTVFVDFQCPWSLLMDEALEKLSAEFDGKIRIAFRHFPLAIHRHAEKAAIAAECAKKQGKFFEYYSVLFKNQKTENGWARGTKSQRSGAESITVLKKYAFDLGLDSRVFNNCIDSNETIDTVLRDLYFGQAIGATGTPTVFVNEKKVQPPAPKTVESEILLAIKK